MKLWQRWRWPVVSWLALSLVFGIMLAYRLEYDFGWHVAAGNYIRAHGVPAHDVFTYTAADFAWVDHEWLHDVLLSWLMSVGGYGLVVLVFAGLWALGVLVAARRWVAPIVLLAAEALLPYAAARPSVWALVGWGVAERVLAAPERWQWLILPILALLWANLHGSFPLLLVLVAVKWWSQPGWWRQWRGGLLLAVCAAATLVNPYGWRVYEEVLRTVLDPGLGGYITEWQALALPVLAVVYAAGYVGLWWQFEAQLSVWRWPLVWLAAALVSARHWPLMVAASLRSFEDYALRLDAARRAGRHGRSLVMWVLFCGLVGGVAQNTWFASRLVGHDAQFELPRAGVVALREHPCAGRVFNDYDFGGYVLWQDAAARVYIDGRMPSWRNADGQRYLDRYYRVLRDEAFRKAEFERYDVRCAVVARQPGRSSARLAAQLQREGWQVRAQDAVGWLLVR